MSESTFQCVDNQRLSLVGLDSHQSVDVTRLSRTAGGMHQPETTEMLEIM